MEQLTALILLKVSHTDGNGAVLYRSLMVKSAVNKFYCYNNYLVVYSIIGLDLMR